MSATTSSQRSGGAKMSANLKRGIGAAAVVVLLVVMGLDTTVVPIGSEVGAASNQFSPEQYGETEFPKVQKAIEQRAAPAPALVKAINEDKQAAVEKYGVPTDIAPIMAVKFTGTLGEGTSGIYNVKVPDVADDLTIRVQTGPAINGTVLRDGVGNIEFGDFKNQIEYQNAAAAINNAMKKQELSGLDRDNLSGKKVTVVGAFQLINPNNWLVTPVRFSVQQ
ncbi:DUF2291 domain-containing protein [Salinisphaera sp. SPP-AMP-43]|uniref:DUF2291 family protein n=1 Tax=Salinisphaera sp. SPP-AMP-43 TaxID=3121288 RepID=UPI003C6DD829